MTIGELRAWLAAEEAKWTPEIEEYAGRFEDIAIYTPAFANPGDGWEFYGYSNEATLNWTSIGMTLEDRWYEGT